MGTLQKYDFPPNPAFTFTRVDCAIFLFVRFVGRETATAPIVGDHRCRFAVGMIPLDEAERPPLWGSDDVSAMRNYRYRHRDSPYVAMRSGERTSRAGRPWAVGGELPGARWRGRPVCARGGRPCRGQRRHKRARVGFFHPHPPSVAARGTAAGRKGGPISSASGSFSSLCWSWGRRTGRRRREAARARRGERHRPCGAARRAVRRGAKRIAQRGLRLAQRGKPFAQWRQ